MAGAIAGDGEATDEEKEGDWHPAHVRHVPLPTFQPRDRSPSRGESQDVSYIERARSLSLRRDTIRYDTRCHFNVRSKADTSQLNLPRGNGN